MTLTTECTKGHTSFTWGCNACDKILKDRVEWWALLKK